MSPLPVLETARLTLRAFKPADLEPMRQLTGNSDFSLTALPDPWTHGPSGPWAVVLRDSDLLIGTIGLSTADHWPAPKLSCEISADYRNEGYATEAAAIVLEFTQEMLALPRVLAICEPDNVAAERVMQKIGMNITSTTVCPLRGVPVRAYERKSA